MTFLAKKIQRQTVNQSYSTLKKNGVGASILKLFLDQGEVVVWRVVKTELAQILLQFFMILPCAKMECYVIIPNNILFLQLKI
jgi:hypothetical protein